MVVPKAIHELSLGFALRGRIYAQERCHHPVMTQTSLCRNIL